MILPNKELLSAVLDEEIHYSEVSYIGINYLAVYWNGGHTKRDINIYELMHLMKEWAFKKRYHIASTLKGSCEILTLKYDFVFAIDYYPEPEAVTKACEWILKEIRC